MSGYLIDTNVALLAALDPERLSRPIRRAIDRGPAFLSTVSYWEIVLKSMKGLLGQAGDPRSWWTRTLSNLALQPLPQSADHIAAICDLPFHHHDPFDRALIAQATVEGLTLVTTDRDIPKYASGRLKVVA